MTEPSPSDRSDPSSSGRLPTFLIIGAPKSGTTSMATYLSGHPDVFMSAEKEVHFFDDHYDRGADWYRAHFAGAGTKPAVGEASPTYYMREETVTRMAALVPDARLVAMLRDPAEAAWSNYWMQRSLGFEHRPFARAVRDEADGTSGRLVNYVSSGRYLRHIEGVCRHYPREQLLVLLFDDLRTDPNGEFSRVCRFIGVDDSVVPPSVGAVVNTSTRLRSERLRRAMLRYHAWKRLPRRVADAMDRWNRYESKYPPINEASRAMLSREYAEENAALGRWLGRDLSGWI